ncbi:MAG TPA: hypothetical protein VNQ90_04860 [Chthoniobacteraceae bacterium]|nr:hypothetical protein [Chthoniobacteraceae bacterium]
MTCTPATRSRSAPARACRGAAFTALELVVAVAIVAALVALVFPVASRVSEGRTAVVCLNRIRNIGQLMSLYISENPRPLSHWYYGAQVKEISVHWQHPLILGNYITARELTRQRCPLIPPDHAYNVDHYAFNLGDPYGYTEKLSPEITGGHANSLRYILNTRAHPEPSRSILFADACTKTVGTMRLFPSGVASDGRIQLRHGGRASLFFLDGHAELADRNRLAALGISEIYTADYRKEILNTHP